MQNDLNKLTEKRAFYFRANFMRAAASSKLQTLAEH